MAVMCNLSYIGLGSVPNSYRFRFQFNNGAPNKYPSWNYDGNYMDIIANNQIKWREGPITFSTSDYLYPGAGWVREVQIGLDEGQDYEIYGRTQDIYGEYPQYLARSASFMFYCCNVGWLGFLESWRDGCRLRLNYRSPQNQYVSWINRDGGRSTVNNGASNNYVNYDFNYGLIRNTARTVEAGLVIPGTSSWACSTRTIRVATTYTEQTNPSFTIKRDTNNSDVIVVSWNATGESYYPNGSEVSRLDQITFYASDGSTKLYQQNVDFRTAGSVRYEYHNACIIKGDMYTFGLVDRYGNRVTYSQNVLSDGITEAFNGFVKVDGKYRKITSAFVKIDSTGYKPINRGMVKLGNKNYKRFC